MSVRRQNITPLGWEIKKRLAEKRMTHSEFCAKYNIPKSRLSEIISGTRENHKYRQRVKDLLDIKD
ncbi:hypothetical protein J9303_11765 [Bacillaceae bacterium Marseille-Q3522]|nr:hypothetical protein [Bacillaceae bacterium Marseille-Q3522]